MTLQPVCDKVETIQGVPLNVTGVAQVKIMKNPELLKEAAEQFLGKNIREIHYAVLQTLEGHLRAILGTLTVEEIYKDREAFATQVSSLAAKVKLGKLILSGIGYCSSISIKNALCSIECSFFEKKVLN